MKNKVSKIWEHQASLASDEALNIIPVLLKSDDADQESPLDFGSESKKELQNQDTG